MSDWWMTIERSDGTIACWHLGDVDDDQRGELITRARAIVDLPVADGVHLHNGPPHDKLLARCTIRDRGELAAVDPAALSGYRARVAQETARANRDAARATLLRLTPDERAQVIAELPTRATGSVRPN